MTGASIEPIIITVAKEVQISNLLKKKPVKGLIVIFNLHELSIIEHVQVKAMNNSLRICSSHIITDVIKCRIQKLPFHSHESFDFLSEKCFPLRTDMYC